MRKAHLSPVELHHKTFGHTLRSEPAELVTFDTIVRQTAAMRKRYDDAGHGHQQHAYDGAASTTDPNATQS